MPADVEHTAAADSGRVILLLIDDAHLNNRLTVRVKRLAREIIDRMAAGDRTAVIYTRLNGRSQDFTDDRRLLHEAVDRFVPGSFASSAQEVQGSRFWVQGSGCSGAWVHGSRFTARAPGTPNLEPAL